VRRNIVRARVPNPSSCRTEPGPGRADEWIPCSGSSALRVIRAATAAVLVLMSAPALADALADGLAAYLSGNYARAVALWVPLAEAGNPDAQNNLGIMYENGEGVGRNAAEAARLFRLAAGRGHADAQFNLGLLYRDGRGVPLDLSRAHMWFSLAAATSMAGMEWGNLGAVAARDALAGKFTPEQIAFARDMARVCLETNYAVCD
jgi:TPR repeat protein